MVLQTTVAFPDKHSDSPFPLHQTQDSTDNYQTTFQ